MSGQIDPGDRTVKCTQILIDRADGGHEIGPRQGKHIAPIAIFAQIVFGETTHCRAVCEQIRRLPSGDRRVSPATLHRNKRAGKGGAHHLAAASRGRTGRRGTRASTNRKP